MYYFLHFNISGLFFPFLCFNSTIFCAFVCSSIYLRNVNGGETVSDEVLIWFYLTGRCIIRSWRQGFSGERVDLVWTDVPRKAWTGISSGRTSIISFIWSKNNGWWWRQYAALKHQYTWRLHSAVFQKAVIFKCYVKWHEWQLTGDITALMK